MRHLGFCVKKKKILALKPCLKATAIGGRKPEKQVKVPLPASGSPAGLALFIGEKLRGAGAGSGSQALPRTQDSRLLDGSGGSLHAALAGTHTHRPLDEALCPLSEVFPVCLHLQPGDALVCLFPLAKRRPMLPPGGNTEVGEVPIPPSEASALSWSRQRALCPGVGTALSFRTLGPLMVV